MTDGTITVHFNDSSSLALAPGKKHFDHVLPSSSGDPSNAQRETYNVDRTPRELRNKLFLVRHFETYMVERLLRQEDYVYSDVEKESGMVYVTKFLRMKHVIVFRLSNDVLQVRLLCLTRIEISNLTMLVQLLRSYEIDPVAGWASRLAVGQTLCFAHVVR